MKVFIIDPALSGYKVPPGSGSRGGDSKCNRNIDLDLKIVCSRIKALSMRLCHPPDGSTSPKYKFLCFITTKKIAKRRMHLLLTGIGAAT